MSETKAQIELLPETKSSSLERKAHGTATIKFDGGCQPNPGNAYGSYHVALNNLSREHNRFSLGSGTNNTAEFDSLLAALSALHELIIQGQYDPAFITVQIFTDSTIVRNRLARKDGGNRRRSSVNPHKESRAEAMRVRAEACLEKLKPFHSFQIDWHSRDRNVEQFGH